MTWHLTEDTTLVYETSNGTYATRRARLWENLATGESRCVITEAPADGGMSITNAAADVAEAVEQAWGPRIQVIEHYPDYGPDDPEHFDTVTVNRFGEPTWKRLDKAVLAAELPGLLDATPEREPGDRD